MELTEITQTPSIQELINTTFDAMDNARSWDEYIKSWEQYEQLLQLKQTK